jgi:type III restriction enzyme
MTMSPSFLKRRRSSYFIPIPASKMRGKQQVIDTEWTKDRIEENTWINRVRFEVNRWRVGGQAGVTRTTTRLLEYWNDADRENRLFVCQIEAVETAIYITVVAKKAGDRRATGYTRSSTDARTGVFPSRRSVRGKNYHLSVPRQRVQTRRHGGQGSGDLPAALV